MCFCAPTVTNAAPPSCVATGYAQPHTCRLPQMSTPELLLAGGRRFEGGAPHATGLLLLASPVQAPPCSPAAAESNAQQHTNQQNVSLSTGSHETARSSGTYEPLQLPVSRATDSTSSSAIWRLLNDHAASTLSTPALGARLSTPARGIASLLDLVHAAVGEAVDTALGASVLILCACGNVGVLNRVCMAVFAAVRTSVKVAMFIFVVEWCMAVFAVVGAFVQVNRMFTVLDVRGNSSIDLYLA